MDKFKLLLSSEKVKEFVKKNYDISSCLMIVSDDKEMNEYIAKLFALSMVCKSEYPCLKCKECQKIISSTSIEFYEYPKFKNGICVDDVNEFVDSLSKKPIENDKKIYIFNNIDEATEDAENKLLKSMEEFPSYAKLIFTATNTHRILRTILSRVQIVRVPSFTYEEFENIISTQKNDSSISTQSLYDISSGNIFYGLKIMQEDETKEIYENCLDMLLNINKGNLLKYSLMINKSNIEEYLKFLSVIVSKMIYSKSFSKGEYELITKGYTLKALTQIGEVIEYSNKKLMANVNEQGIIDNLLIKIMESKI